mmetsp:Transcript_5945/g.6797  ORF Transcript_5945/g.6797 Transcript_5945/m.6797 type:complete len:123 (+) Transcript_5945:409-777(+)
MQSFLVFASIQTPFYTIKRRLLGYVNVGLLVSPTAKKPEINILIRQRANQFWYAKVFLPAYDNFFARVRMCVCRKLERMNQNQLKKPGLHESDKSNSSGENHHRSRCCHLAMKRITKIKVLL